MARDLDELMQLRDVAFYTFIYTGLVTDLIEFMLITATIVYCVAQFRRERVKDPEKQVSISIWMQLFLMWTQSLLFTTGKVFITLKHEIYDYKNTLPTPIYNC